METFPAVIEKWHDFFATIGTAGPALLGLLFVAATINVECFSHPRAALLRIHARQTFASFFILTVVAILFLVPDPTPSSIGGPLAIIGATEIALALRSVARLRASHHNTFDEFSAHYVLWRLLLPVLAYVTLILLGIDVMNGVTLHLNLIVPLVVLILAVASGNTWALLMRLAALKVDLNGGKPDDS